MLSVQEVQLDMLTLTLRTLTREFPIWPAILRPGSTRDGVALAPMEPCCRFDFDPCVMSPRFMPHRLIEPAVKARCTQVLHLRESFPHDAALPGGTTTAYVRPSCHRHACSAYGSRALACWKI